MNNQSRERNWYSEQELQLVELIKREILKIYSLIVMINPDFLEFYYYDYALQYYCSKMTENGWFFIENDKI